MSPDLLFLGRIAVDLYGEQIDTPLEETRSFTRYPGGSSGNMAIAAARAGARVGLISTVGDDPMGRFLMQRLAREGIDTTALTIHPTRRTALAFLGMLRSEADRLDFYRTDAADTAIDTTRVEDSYLSTATHLVVTGTHLADPTSNPAVLDILDRAFAADVLLTLDIDLRRDLWAGFEGGFEGSVDRVSALLARFEMIVGNEEEVTLFPDLSQRHPRQQTVIRKLGPRGARLDGPDVRVTVSGRAIKVVNPVGAGDAFLGNFMAALQRGDTHQQALSQANTAGALVATRHGCANDMPFPTEIARFSSTASQSDPELAHLHRTTLRSLFDKPVVALACDHRKPFDTLIEAHARGSEEARRFKRLVFGAMQSATAGRSDVQPAMLMDPKYGNEVLIDLAEGGYWAGRPIEVTGSRPIEFEAGSDIANEIASWRPGQVAKVLVWYSANDPDDLRALQIERLHHLQSACRAAGIEWMLELVPPLDNPRDDALLCRGVVQCYEAGLLPDWWKLPALESAEGWRHLEILLEEHDPQCRGVVVLGLNEPAESLGAALYASGAATCCKGFAVGRTIFGDAAEDWFAGRIGDETAISRMAALYGGLIDQFMQGNGGADAGADKAE